MGRIGVPRMRIQAKCQVVRDGHYAPFAPLTQDLQDPSLVHLTIDADLLHVVPGCGGQLIEP